MTITAPASINAIFTDGKVFVRWDLSSVPAGLSVLVEAVNAGGAPLDPQPSVTYGEGTATLTWASIPDGTAFSVRARFVGGWAGPVGGVAYRLAAVAAPTLTWSGGSLHVQWTPLALDGININYEVALGDASGTALTVQPAVNSTGSASVDYPIACFAAAGTWTVLVRAKAGVSLGPWSVSAPLHIDPSRPDSPLLQALLGRLQAAVQDNRLTLDPQTLQLPGVTRQLAQLLALPAGTLSVASARLPLLRSDVAGVHVEGHAVLPLGEAKVLLSFGVPKDSETITLVLSATDLGNRTVAALQTAGLLPNTYIGVADWGRQLIALPNVQIKLDTAAATLTVTSGRTTENWGLAVGLNVSISTVQAAISATINPATLAVDWLPELSTSLIINNTKIPIRLRLPVGYMGWGIRLDTTAGPFHVGTLATLAPLFGGGDSGLPADVAGMPGFEIDYLELGFAAAAAMRWDLAAGLAIRGSSPLEWKPVGDAITLKELRADLRMLLLGGPSVTTTVHGSLGATLVLGNSVTASASLGLPAGPEGYTLDATVATANAPLTALAPLLGGITKPLTDTLDHVGTVQPSAVGHVGIHFTTGAETEHSF
ncbi:MAG: hypothetical protein NTX45_00310 [Proteobacteria bacterium]|nr:hypothetical protein [Pseudomonadota bacterium]